MVEDDPFIAMDMRQTLENAGALVVGPAYNLADALRLAEVANLRAAGPAPNCCSYWRAS